MPSSARATWLAPAGLIALSAIPVLVGSLRLADLSGGTGILPSNPTYVAAPAVVVVHIVSASVFSILGALQFDAGFRRRRRRWHRAAGRVLVPLGLAAALSGLWMTQLLPRPADDSTLLTAFRFVFGTAMVVSLLLGAAAIRRRDFARHGAWMTRGYAIGLGAGTQLLTQLTWLSFGGEMDPLNRALLLLAAWLINLAVAEWAIRRRGRPTPRTAAPAVVPQM